MKKKYDTAQLETVLKRLEAFVGNPYQNLFLCRKDSGHQALSPVIKDGAIYLTCLDCDYEEELGPEFFEDLE